MWGGLCALISTVLLLTLSPENVSLTRLLLIWVLWPAGGIIWGLGVWWRMSRNRLRLEGGRR